MPPFLSPPFFCSFHLGHLAKAVILALFPFLENLRKAYPQKTTFGFLCQLLSQIFFKYVAVGCATLWNCVVVMMFVGSKKYVALNAQCKRLFTVNADVSIRVDTNEVHCRVLSLFVKYQNSICEVKN